MRCFFLNKQYSKIQKVFSASGSQRITINGRQKVESTRQKRTELAGIHVFKTRKFRLIKTIH